MKLTDERQSALKAQFEGTPDRDLIQELLRRERFKVIEYSASYWIEMKGEPEYMAAIKRQVLSGIARHMDTSGAVRDECQYDATPTKGVFCADVIVLVPRKKEDSAQPEPVKPTVFDQFGPAAP